MSSSVFQAGERVRLLSDPGRIGVLTNRTRLRGETVMHYVQFSDQGNWLMQDELELVDELHNDVYSLLIRNHFGRVQDLRRNMTRIQLAGRLANLIYSMDTTNTEFYAYQYKPVISFLESPAKGILIADEVGLGKTIEAGLIWTELRARFDTRRLMVVCPAMLCEKWQLELATRFGIEAKIMKATELLHELQTRQRSNYPHGRAIICSYSGLRPPRASSMDEGPRRQLGDFLERQAGEEPLFDMIIFDEAHNLRNPESSTSRLGRLLRETADNLILLSATPINLRSQDLYQLLNIVDSDTFNNEMVFPKILQANQSLIEAKEMALDRRCSWLEIRTKLAQAKQHHLLEKNCQLHNLIQNDFSPTEFADERIRIELSNKIERCNLLSKVVTRTRKAEVKELRVVREPHLLNVGMTEIEAALYQEVTQLVRRYATHKDINEGFLQATPQRQLSSCMYAAIDNWRKSVAIIEADKHDGSIEIYEDFGAESSVSGKGISPLMSSIVSGLAGGVSMQALWDNDSKFTRLQHLVDDYLQDRQEEKIIIFSYFRGTLHYLSNRLENIGYRNQILMGGMAESKQSIIDRFREQAGIRILLASEVASEGVDLQFCRVLINYDLPWNPMRIEQRIGRIDRHGQKADKISIFNFCYDDTIDQRICSRLYERLQIFTSSLGNMEAILGEKVQELTHALLSEQLTPEQEHERIEQTRLAIARLQREQEELEEQASNLIAHGGHILQEINAAHDFSKRITDYDLMLYVKDYLNRYCQGATFIQLTPEQLDFNIQLPSLVAADLNIFIMQERLFGLTKLDAGMKITCKFMNKVVNQGVSGEIINQSHPLIRFISHKLHEKQEAFIPLISAELCVRDFPDLFADGYVAVMKRTSFEGIKIEEKLIARAINLRTGELISSDLAMQLINTVRLKGRDWPNVRFNMDMAVLEGAFSSCDEKLQQDHEFDARQRKAENNDRIELQMVSARSHLHRLIESLQSVIQKHRATGNRDSLIKATEGKINKLRSSFDLKMAILEKQKKLKYSMDEVGYLVINIIAG